MTERRLLLSLALSLAVAGPGVVAFAALPDPAPGSAVLVVAGPLGDAETLVAAAGGRLIGPVQPRIGRLAASPDPLFAASLRAAGAWIIVSDPRILALCGVAS